MKTQEYVNKLFNGYDDTPELKDFKMEITANLDDRIADLEKKGLSSSEAFSKAVSELGNITEIADEISKQKRNEIINRMYIHQNFKIDAKHALGYVVAGILLILSVILIVPSFMDGSLFLKRFEDSWLSDMPDIVWTLTTPIFPMFFISLSGAIFTFFGLTQETLANFPMNSKRAFLYSLPVGVGIFGIAFALTSYLNNTEIVPMLLILALFLIPAAGLLAFLLLTEKNRYKPWVAETIEKYASQYSNQFAEQFAGKNAELFGMQSAILWTLSIAIFIAFGVLISFKYSWMVFLFGIVGQLVLVYMMMCRNRV